MLSSLDEKLWRIKTERKEHIIEYTTGLESGEVLLDGNIVGSKGLSCMGVLMKNP